MFIKTKKQIFSKVVAVTLLFQLIIPVSLPQAKAVWADVYTKLLIHSDTTNGSTDFVDSSGNHWITANWNAQHSTVQKKFGNSAMYFDGTGDYLEIADGEDWDFGGNDFTVDTWIYPTVLGTNQGVWHQGETAGNQSTNGLEISSANKLRWLIRNTSGTVLNMYTTMTLSTNTWYHVATVRSGNYFRIYVNGTLAAESASISTALEDYDYPFFIGGRSVYGDINTLPSNWSLFNGYLDEVRVTKGLARWTGDFTSPNAPYGDEPRQPSVSLTSDAENNQIDVEITDNGDTGAFYPDAAIELDETGLVGHWKIDGDFTDSSGNGNHGTANGGATATADGQRKQAGNFDGVDDYVDTGTPIELNLPDLTISAWVKLDVILGNAVTNYNVFSNENYQNSGYMLRVQDTPDPLTAGKISFRVNQAGAAQSVIAEVWTYPDDNAWHYLVATKNGTVGKIYIDGEEAVLSTNNILTNAVDATVSSKIGISGTAAQPFNGFIDDVKIYNRALSAWEAKTRYKKDSLVGYWKFDDQGTSVTSDYSGNWNDGTLTNMSGASNYVEGQVGKALEFDGVDDYVNLNYGNDFDSSVDSFTASVWFKADSIGDSRHTILDQGGADGEWRDILTLHTNESLYTNIGNWIFYSNSTFQTDKWYYVTVTYELSGINATRKIYVNGELDAENILSNPESSGNAILLWRDYYVADREFDGSIDEVAIHSQALSDLEIRQAYEATRPRFEIEQKETTLSDFDIPEKIEQDLIAETINDVFIYDTRKDSVDGSWKSDAVKSWYTENSSATRCPNGYQDSGTQKCTRDFPEKTILVGTDTAFYIYDAESKEIWMRFDEAASGEYLSGNISNISGIFVLNGKIYLTKNNDGSNTNVKFISIDFVQDKANVIYHNTDYYSLSETISGRNLPNTPTLLANNYIPNGNINDVHTAVIDEKTYVAVATDGGMSVINETDGTVVNLSIESHTGTDFDITEVSLLPNGSLYFSMINNATSANHIITYYNVQDITTSEVGWAEYRSGYYNLSTSSGNEGWNTNQNPAIFISEQSISSLSVTENTSPFGGNTIYLGTGEGITILQEKQGDEENGSVKYITSEYETEEMVGDIRGMWTFDGANALTDNSVKVNDLTNIGGVDFSSASVRGKAASFDGVDDYLEIADNIDLDIFDKITMSAWIKGNSYNENNILIHKDSAYGLWYDWTGSTEDDGELQFMFHNGTAWQVCDSGFTPNINEWYQVAATYDSSLTKCTFYINGNLQETKILSGNINDGTDLRIGGWSSWDYFFDGLIDEPFITAEALDASTIKRMYDTGKKNLEAQDSLSDGLVGYWKMDWDFTDTSGNGNDGVANGGVSTASGKFSEAGSFDGVDDYVDLGLANELNFTSENFTFSTWAKPLSTRSNQRAFSKGDYEDDGYEIFIDNNVSFRTYQSGAYQTTTSWGLIEDEWQHIVVVRNGADATIYVNGEDITSVHDVHIDPVAPTSRNAIIGRYTANYHYDGSLDDVAIYNRALTIAEISRMYDSGKSLHDTGFKHRLTGTSDSVRDLAVSETNRITVATADGATEFDQFRNVIHSFSIDDSSALNTSILNNNINNVAYLDGQTVLGYNVTGGIEMITRAIDLTWADTFSDTSATDQANPDTVIVDDGVHLASTWSNDASVDYSWNVPNSNGTTYDYTVTAIDMDGEESQTDFITNGGFEDPTKSLTLYTGTSRITTDKTEGEYAISNSTGYAMFDLATSIPDSLARTFEFCADLKQSWGATALFYVDTGIGSDGGRWQSWGIRSPTISWDTYCQTVTVEDLSAGVDSITRIRMYRENQIGTLYVDNITFEEVKSATITTPITIYETVCNTSATGTTLATTQTGTNVTCDFADSATNYIHVRTSDEAGNFSDWTHQGPYLTDTSTPDIISVDAGVDSGDRTSLTTDTWFNVTGIGDTVSFSWTDANSLSDDTYYYELNTTSGATITGTGGTSTSNNFIDNIAVTEGISYMHIRPMNGADTWGTERTFTVKYDGTAPTLDSKTTYTTDWYTSDQTSTFTFTDAGSGIASGNNPICTISTEGTSVTCTNSSINVCDNAGNCNTTNQTSNSIKLDKSLPTVTTPTDEGTISSDQTLDFNWTGNDSISGVASYEICIDDDKTGGCVATATPSSATYSWNGATWGITYYAKVRAIDNAGNTSLYSAWSDGVTPDGGGPILSASNADIGDWFSTGSSVIQITATDADSGLDKVTYNWWSSANATSTETSNNAFLDIISNGVHTLYLWAKDMAGNTSTWSGEYWLDTIDPIAGTISYTDGVQASTDIDITIVYGTDVPSGMSSNDSDYLLEYSVAVLDNNTCGTFGAWLDSGLTETSSTTDYTYTGITGNCYKFRYTTKDDAANETIYTSTNETTLMSQPNTPVIDNYNDGITTQDTTPTLQFDLSDNDTNEQIKYQLQIDNNPTFNGPEVDVIENSYSSSPRNDVTYTAPFLPNSQYYWRVRAIDDNGLESDWATASTGFVIDTILPISTILYPQDRSNLKYVKHISGRASDSNGIQKTRISIYDNQDKKYYTGLEFSSDTEIWIDTVNESSAGAVLSEWSYLVDSSKWVDLHTYIIRSRGIDMADNEEHTDSITFVYDTLNGQEGSIYVSNPAVSNNSDYNLYFPTHVGVLTTDYIEINFPDTFRFSPWMEDADIAVSDTSDGITSTSDSIDRLNKTITSTITGGSVAINDMLIIDINNLRIHNPSATGSYLISFKHYDSWDSLIGSGTGEIVLVNPYQQVELNVDVQQSLQLSVDSGAVLLEVDPDVQLGQNWVGTGGAVSEKTDVTVKTNAISGYNLMISLAGNTATGSAVLDGTTDTGNTITSTTADRVNEENNFSFSTNSGSNATGVAFNNSSTQVSGAGTSAPTNSFVDNIYYYLNIDYTTPSDTYQGTVTYTAVGEF